VDVERPHARTARLRRRASKADFIFVEAAVQLSLDVAAAAAKHLNDLISTRGGQDICVYGPSIYDRGHCC
jgi:hypothetical protein